MIEVLLALGLLATAVLAILGMFPALAKTNKNTMQSSTHLYAQHQYNFDECITGLAARRGGQKSAASLTPL